MNRWLIPLGSLTAIVIGIVAVLAVAGAFDSDDSGPTDESTSALCAEGVEDCDDTAVVGDGDETGSPTPAGSSDGASATPLDSEPTIGDDTEADDDRALAIEAAFAALEEMGGPPAAEVEVTEVRAVDWPNSCLGVEAPGIACAQVITPGYIVFLDAGWGPYTFHADTNGNVILAGLPR